MNVQYVHYGNKMTTLCDFLLGSNFETSHVILSPRMPLIIKYSKVCQVIYDSWSLTLFSFYSVSVSSLSPHRLQRHRNLPVNARRDINEIKFLCILNVTSA